MNTTENFPSSFVIAGKLGMYLVWPMKYVGWMESNGGPGSQGNGKQLTAFNGPSGHVLPYVMNNALV